MRLTFIAIAALFIISTSSCRKNYTCECSYTLPTTGARPAQVQTDFKEVEGKTKEDAREECDRFEASYINGSCKLQ